MRLSQTAPDIGIPLNNGVGELVRVDLSKKSPQGNVMSRKVFSIFNVFDNFCVDHDAGGYLMVFQPRCYQGNYRRSRIKQSGKRAYPVGNVS
jgi:hypothetical protein